MKRDADGDNQTMKKDRGPSIVLVVSRFNDAITTALKQGALNQWASMGFSSTTLPVWEVPGAIEIPLMALKLAKTRQVQAIVALGAVIRGETDHYDYVCEQVSQGCQQVMLTYEIPVIFGILTTDTEAQAWDRLGGAHGHKGVEAIIAAVEMVALLKRLEGKH